MPALPSMSKAKLPKINMAKVADDVKSRLPVSVAPLDKEKNRYYLQMVNENIEAGVEDKRKRREERLRKLLEAADDDDDEGREAIELDDDYRASKEGRDATIENALDRDLRFARLEQHLERVEEGKVRQKREKEEIPQWSLGAGEIGWSHMRYNLPTWVNEPQRTDYVSPADYKRKLPKDLRKKLLQKYTYGWQMAHRHPKYLTADRRHLEREERQNAGALLRHEMMATKDHLLPALPEPAYCTSAAERYEPDRRGRKKALKRSLRRRKQRVAARTANVTRSARDLRELEKKDEHWWQAESRHRAERGFKGQLKELVANLGGKQALTPPKKRQPPLALAPLAAGSVAREEASMEAASEPGGRRRGKKKSRRRRHGKGEALADAGAAAALADATG